MSRYADINPMDIDPDTGRPYSNYSSPSLDISFADGERCDDEEDAGAPGPYYAGDVTFEDDIEDEPDDFYSDDPRAMQGMGQPDYIMRREATWA